MRNQIDEMSSFIGNRKWVEMVVVLKWRFMYNLSLLIGILWRFMLYSRERFDCTSVGDMLPQFPDETHWGAGTSHWNWQLRTWISHSTFWPVEGPVLHRILTYVVACCTKWYIRSYIFYDIMNSVKYLWKLCSMLYSAISGHHTITTVFT